MSATDVRKNFVFKKEVAKHLEKIAQKENKSMTAVLQEMIEERYKKISKEEKLEAFKNIVGSMSGMLKEKSIQSIKAEMGSSI